MDRMAVASRIRNRANTSAFDAACWLMALLFLAVVIPAVDAIARNDAFFAAHGVGVITWFIAVIVTLGLLGLLLFALARGAMELPEPYGDIALSTVTFLLAWFAAGNILARAVFAGLPTLGWIVGAILAVALALAARQWQAGRALLACATLASIAPVALSAFETGSAPVASLEFDQRADRPSLAWIISDELQYSLVIDAQGKVRPEFPNLARLQRDATTYTHAYAVANYTDFAVPAMMNGISDVSKVADVDRMRASRGFIPGLASEYAIVMQSPIYRFECDDPSCVTAADTREADSESLIDQLRVLLADTAAVAGRTLGPPYAEMFPSLDGKWRDFWAGGDEFGSGASGSTVDAVIARWKRAQESGAPTFTFWHSIRTHAPWSVDREGKDIYPPKLPVVEGAHMVGTDRTGLMRSAELASMERRLYANSAVDFDRQLGRLLDVLDAAGAYDDTLILVTADHGAGITFTGDRRYGDSLVQRWTEVAHVPLLVKQPGQQEPRVVAEPRSNGQIAQTILDAAGAKTAQGLELSPSLAATPPQSPVFSTIAGGKGTPWVYDGAPQPDPWAPADISPPDPDHPFAIGIDPSLLSQPVPAGWIPAQAPLTVLPGQSTQQLIVAQGPEAQCTGAVGLVSADNRVIGSLLWEEKDRADGRWGWAIVPKADEYQTWCTPAG